MKNLYTAGLLALVGLAGGAGCLCQQYRAISEPGDTMEETAKILVHDFKFGMRAKQKAIQHGDAILPLIQKESDDFQILDGRNAFWIGDVLGAIRTEHSRKVLLDLYSRTNALSRLTAAVGLAQHKAMPNPIDEDSFLITTVRTDPNQAETELAVIALGWSGDENALPCLFDLLKKRPVGYRQVYACEALARIGSEQAIPVLRDGMKSEQLLHSAFKALIALGDREAVPLAIAKVNKDSVHIVRELRTVTGRSYGYNRARWEKWWNSARGHWQIPDEFTRPWDGQE